MTTANALGIIQEILARPLPDGDHPVLTVTYSDGLAKVEIRHPLNYGSAEDTRFSEFYAIAAPTLESAVLQAAENFQFPGTIHCDMCGGEKWECDHFALENPDLLTEPPFCCDMSDLFNAETGYKEEAYGLHRGEL